MTEHNAVPRKGRGFRAPLAGDTPWLRMAAQRTHEQMHQDHPHAAPLVRRLQTPVPTPPPPEPEVSLQDMMEELRALKTTQLGVEGERQRELDLSKLAEEDPGHPLQARGLFAMTRFFDDAAPCPLHHLISYVINVISAVDSREKRTSVLLNRMLQSALQDDGVRRGVERAFEDATREVVVEACGLWLQPVTISRKGFPEELEGVAVGLPEDVELMSGKELLRVVEGSAKHAAVATRHAATTAVRLYAQTHQHLVRAALRHVPSLRNEVAPLQHAYDSTCARLHAAETVLGKIAKELGSLRMGLAKEEARLGLAQRQLGTIARFEGLTSCFKPEANLPLDWSRDDTFHLRSKYTFAEGPNSALYSTGDERLFTGNQLVRVGILQCVALVIAQNPDIDDTLETGTSDRGGCLAGVLGTLAMTWADLLNFVLSNGRLSQETLEARYSTERVTVRLRAVQFLLQNLMRELKGATTGVRLSETDIGDEQLFEHCRYYVVTLSPDLLLIFNWLVVLQSITNIAERTTPKEHENTQYMEETKQLRLAAKDKAKALDHATLSLNGLVAVIGNSG